MEIELVNVAHRVKSAVRRVTAAAAQVQPRAQEQLAYAPSVATIPAANEEILPRFDHRDVSRRGAARSGRRVMIFGSGDIALKALQILTEAASATDVVGFYSTEKGKHGDIIGRPVFSRDTSLIQTAHALGVDEILVAVGDRRGGVLPLRELIDCRLSGIRVFDLATYFEQRLGRIPIDSLKASWLVFGGGFRHDFLRRVVKRVFDVACSLILLVATLPVMALTALLIALESGLPLLYRQQRVGQGNRPFDVLKFRSMCNDAEKDGKPVWAGRNDCRVTRVGRIMRKLRIDELPQLINVLKGEMSLVGPRPERPFFVEELTAAIPFYAVRHALKPGITGWAQVRYHYGASKEDAARKLEYDLYYVKNHCLSLDFHILFKTVHVVLTGKGAQ